MTFQELGLADPILKAINSVGYTQTTEIQRRAIPILLKGKDIIGCAQTGTGKTAAFAIPILQLLSKEPKHRHRAPKALILAPTRELAIQIGDSFLQYAKYLDIKQTVIFGGVSPTKQIEQLKNGVDIIIATPGRLLDLFNQGFIVFRDIRFLVLDEADNMLDMGFIHDIKKVLKQIPQKRHTLFFSATMPPPIRKFANSILMQPEEINVTPVSSTAQTVEQFVYFVEKKDKVALLLKIMAEHRIEQTLVFTRTKHGADRLAKQLAKKDVSVASIHGNKSQNARQKALQDFRKGSVHLLIATDIAARGIDIEKLPYVINYDLPNDAETYVHRIGRTGRAGKSGAAFSFCSEEQKKELQSIQKLIGFQLTVLE